MSRDPGPFRTLEPPINARMEGCIEAVSGEGKPHLTEPWEPIAPYHRGWKREARQ